MKKIAYDSMALDQLKIVEDSKCCLKVNAVLTKEGVYPYPDGRAFKSRMELLKATRTARAAKVTIRDHPDSLVIMSQNQMYGTVEKPFFDRDRIRAIINFDKDICPSDFLDGVRAGQLKDVSIGFYYKPDFTPGKWNGTNYDYIMRDIVIDHVATGVLKGRCTFPQCGIGVDTMMRRISFVEDKVEKRGSQWCVIHCHGPDAGKAIKCFPTKEQAEAMHRAIQARKHGATLNVGQTDQDKKPPKEWMDKCKAVVKEGKPDYTEEQVNAVCGNIWHHHPEQHGIGDICNIAVDVLSGIIKKGGIEKMSEPDAGETTETEFQKCVRERMELGHTEGEAKDLCMAYATPTDQPTPVQAPTPQEETGQTGGAQEVEKTELERCIENKVDEGMSEEEAKQWCEAEQAGEHQSADTLIKRSQELLRLKEHRDIERNRQARRHPL